MSSDGSTLYVPGSVGEANNAGVLNAVSAATGEVIQSIALGLPAEKVILTGNGSKAFVLEAGFPAETIVVQAVDLVAGNVAGSIVLPAQGYRDVLDFAISPNGSDIFISLTCGYGVCASDLPPPCTVTKGICIYDATTLAFKAEVPNLTGILSVSQDSNSLYIAPTGGDAGSIFVLNTQTLIKSQIQLGGYVSGPPVISPLGKYAVVFVTSDSQTKAAILDTSTNQFVKTLFATAPANESVTSGGDAGSGVSKLAAFAPDGKSIWAFLYCTPGNSCSLPNGINLSLAGFAFPAGTLISNVPLPTQNGFSVSLAFPQVVRQ